MSRLRPAPVSFLRTGAVAVAAVLAATLPLSALPAHAAAPLRPGPYYEKPTPFDDSGEFDPECAGLDLEVHYEASGVYSTRHVLGSGRQAFFTKQRTRFEETWTDLSTGEVLFTITGKDVFEEISAARVRKSEVPRRLVPDRGLKGPIFLFTSTQTGGDVIRDETGALLYWNGGQLTFTNLFDTRGDREPGGRSLRFRTVKAVGHHPLEDKDICDVAAEEVAKP
ncbi:MAG: hypothetical protein WBQ50_13775 [Nocardioides sp.]